MKMNIENLDTNQVNTSGAYPVQFNCESVTRIMRKAEVLQATGISNTTLFEQIKDFKFIKGFNIGGRAVGWFEHEVAAIIMARAAGRSEDELKSLIELMTAKREQAANDYLASLTA
jgi:prophage regulatory protein